MWGTFSTYPIPAGTLATCPQGPSRSSSAGQSGSFLLESGADRVHSPLFIGKLAALEFRVNQVPVDTQLEAPATRGDQFELLDFLLVSAQQLARQTDGLRLVISHRAIFQFHVHRFSPKVISAQGYRRVRFFQIQVAAKRLHAMPVTYPPTVIVRNPRENPRKCSILPLRGREDMIFLGYPLTGPVALENYVRLAVEGDPLSLRDADKGLLLLDASWRRAGPMERDFRDVPPRSLHGYRTAYPRRSKRGWLRSRRCSWPIASSAGRRTDCSTTTAGPRSFFESMKCLLRRLKESKRREDGD